MSAKGLKGQMRSEEVRRGSEEGQKRSEEVRRGQKRSLKSEEVRKMTFLTLMTFSDP
jgi:hypothetical protein